MQPRDTVKIQLENAEATAAIARRIAPHLVAGDCLLLSGSIGAGKTHFARALIQTRLAAVGLWEDVPSPTFTLVQTYDDTHCEIWHADLYRLTGPDELQELGIDDAFKTAITLIEWPDRMADMRPDQALEIHLEVSGSGRLLTVAWDDPRIAVIEDFQ